MTGNDSPLTISSFQRLEDFPSFISCIKCFGKPIIPPLLTKEEKDEIFAFKEAAVRKEADVLNKKVHLSLSKKVRDAYHRSQEHLVSNDEDDFISNSKLSLPEKSALSLNSMNAHLSSSNISYFSDEMLVSMSKLPSSGICSTVHRGVIVCPNEVNAGKKHDDLLNIPSKCPFNSSDQNIYSHQFLNSECHLCQVDCHQDFLPARTELYENVSNEQLCSVSEDEQGSFVMEDTDFESLPTVISAKKLNIRDTDDESNVTCLTQSTDLEKYMDCSIEYSSDDLVSVANSQVSSQNTMSYRSDDASSETLVNTESELTPCASAMAELNGYSNDAPTRIAEPLSNVSSAETSTSSLHDRAYSVDSYLGIIKACTENLRALPMKKSQSEPSHSNIVPSSRIRKNLFSANDTVTCLIENEDKTESNPETLEDDDQEAEVSELFPMNATHCNDRRSISESKSEESSLHKKTHVRTRSYTLDYPSSALIMAHANCDCKSDDPENASPHSFTPEKNKIPLNLAFQKEKVNVILPPTPDRDKLFPILSTSYSSSVDSISTQNSESKLSSVLPSSTDSPVLGTSPLPIFDNSKDLDHPADDDTAELTSVSNKNINSESEGPEESVMSAESVDNNQCNPNSNPIEIQLEEVNSELTGTNFYNNEMKTLPLERSEDTVNVSAQVSEMSATVEKEVANENIQVFLNQIFKDIQESQKMRVNQLLQEQNKQWLQLQEEFKEQERLLCAKLNFVSIPSVSDHDFSSIPPQHFSGSLSEIGAMENMPMKQNIRPNVKASSISDISNEECCTASEPGNKKYHNKNHMSELLNNSNNIQELKISGTLLPNSNEAISEPIGYSDSRLLPSNISSDKSDDLESSNCGELASAIKSTEGSFGDRLDVVSNTNSQVIVLNTNDQRDNTSSPLDHRCDGTQSSSSIKSPVSFDRESENVTSNASFSRTNDVPSSLSLPQKSTVFPNYLDISHDKSGFKNSNILLQSSYDLPQLIKYFPLPVSSITPDEATKRSSLSHNYEIHQGSCGVQQFIGDREICSLSPVSPCICFAVHQQEFNADCPHCHACMNCDTNCLKHVNYPKTDFRELNGYSDVEDSLAGKYNNPGEYCDPVCSGYLPENQGYTVNSENVKSDSFHADLIETESCDDKECLLKGNNDNKTHLPRNVSNVNIKKDTAVKICKTNKDLLIRKGKLKSTSNEKIYPSGSSNNSCKSHELRLKNSIVSRSPKKNLPINQKFKKIPVDVPLLCKADTLKKVLSPSLTNLKRRQSRDVLEFINDPGIQKKLEKLPAFVKGYLTRRLFQTERVQDLVKTLKDTVLIIGKLSDELTSKGNPVSEQDVDFHRQLIVQLMSTFRNVYDIFCTYSIKEQMEIISESRSYQLKKKASDSQISSVVSVVSEKSNSSIPPKKSKLSAATVKTLERKRRSTIDSRTYTIEDFKGCRPRICSKSRVTSPSRIYKSAMDLNFKSKTRGLKTQHWK